MAQSTKRAARDPQQQTPLETKSTQAQTFWRQWVEAAFPDLDSRAYFLPPVYFNRVPMTRQSAGGLEVLVLHEAPGQAGQSTAGQTFQSTAGQAGQSAAGQAGQSAAGQTFQSTAGQAGQSTAGQTFQSTAGQAGQSRTGHAGQSRPGQAGQSRPGQAGQSTPGQTNQPLTSPSTAAQPSSPQLQLPRVQDSDIRDDAAMQRVLVCLQKMCEENREVLVGLSQLQFGQYLGEPCYAAAAAKIPLPDDLSQNSEGDFDVLLIHRHYGIVVCETKCFGDNVTKLNMSQLDLDKNIRKKLKEAVSQLNKAEAMLSHLVSDVTPGLRITKTIAVPNLTARQVQQAISDDLQLTQDLCRCLGTTDPADITGLCLCSDQLSDPQTPWDVSSDVLRELGNWWQRRVAVSGPDSHMTCDIYKTLVARFCGPATTVTVPCIFPPRLCVKTLGQAVSLTGECYTAQITLFPEQLHLVNMAHPRVFVAGPPGTGKTVVLLLKATEWLRCGKDVYVVSTWWWSLAACSMLYHLLLQIVNTLPSVASPGQPHFSQYEFTRREDVEKALNDLLQAARGGSLYVIADEAGPVRSDFQTFCDELLTQVPGLHLWAASCYHGHAPPDWYVEYFTRPLRSPPAVVREVQRDVAITKWHEVVPYSERGVASHTDGPPVRQLHHRGQGHSGRWPEDCFKCGREVAIFLHSLRVDPADKVPTTSQTLSTTSGATTPPFLQWRDVLALYYGDVSDQSGMITALKEADIPVRVMKDDDIEDVATARSDVVWVADGRRVFGLERKVIICLDYDWATARLDFMSRCTSQLVIVSCDQQPAEHESSSHPCHLL